MEEKLNKSEKCCNNQDIIDDGVALATNILNLIHLLHFRVTIIIIIVGEILPRVKTPPSCPNYNSRVTQLNRTLLTFLKQVSFAM